MNNLKISLIAFHILFTATASASFFNRSTPYERTFPLDAQSLAFAADLNVGYLMPSGCPGTLITPSKVVVAAHCLDNRNQDYYQPSDLTFIYGESEQQYHNLSVSRIQPKQLPQRPPAHDDWGRYLTQQSLDIAVIELVQPAQMRRLIQIGVEASKVYSESYFTIGFPVPDPANDYSQVMMVDTCEIKDHFHTAVFNSNCSFGGGSSGGPMFWLREDKLVLTGIMIGDKFRNTPTTRRDYTPEGATYGLMFLSKDPFTQYLQNLISQENSNSLSPVLRFGEK